jgi:V/A-type H+-transporting ATPase subunit D
MARISLNKTSLKKERDQLELYRQFLPSLDLKRQQFLQEHKKEREQAAATERELADLQKEAEEWLPFLANERTTASQLVRIEDVQLKEENVLGMSLPIIQDIKISVAGYSTLTTPLWFDGLARLLEECARLSIRLKIEKKRVAMLNEALQTITKRVNLFDRVLIPESEQNIRYIRIALADMERAGVIRAKLAKNKKQSGGL